MNEPSKRRKNIAILAVLLAACCWALTGVSFLIILDTVKIDEVTLSLLRAVTATTVAWIGLLLFSRDRLRIRRADILPLIGYGLWSVTLFYVVTAYGFSGTSAAIGTTLLSLAPAIVTLIAAVAFGEPLTPVKIGALILCFSGVLLVVRIFSPDERPGTTWGYVSGLLAAVSYAGYSLFGKRLLGRFHPATVVAYYLLFGAVGLLLVKAVSSPADWPPASDLLRVAIFTGLITTLIPTSLYLFALTRLPASNAAILATLEPVVSVLLAATILHEKLDGWQWLGAGAVIGGMLLLTLSGRLPVEPRQVG